MSTLFVAFEDFILSREAMLCSPETIDFYPKPFLALANGSQPSNHMVRSFLAAVAQRGVASATVHAHARAARGVLSLGGDSLARAGAWNQCVSEL